MKVSIVIPCLNEHETLEAVIIKAKISLEKYGHDSEIIVSDNGSDDNSVEIAIRNGARVVFVAKKGYGSALQKGISSAQGEFIVMGDADDSYALNKLDGFFEKLEHGYDLVMGNRFLGGIEKGAMPWLHKYLGNPVLSWLGRLFFKVPIGDFHCGLRAFRKESIVSLNLQTTGMEFASEMVVKAALNGLRIAEVPTTLKKDGRSTPSHLRTWRDGWRHLIFLLAASPRWLFLYPGLMLFFMGLTTCSYTAFGAQKIGLFQFNLNTFIIGVGILIAGTQTILMSILARIFASRYGFLPTTKSISRLQKYFTLERGIVLGLSLIFLAFTGLLILVSNWNGVAIESLTPEQSIRLSSFFVLTLSVGIQIFFASFFASLLQV